MSNINIYFSASIKGGRMLVDTYKIMIEELKRYGNVLTEHIGDANYAKVGFLPAKEVYDKDISLLRNSNIVIAEISVPSLGVGYELAFAEKLEIPTYCFYKSGSTVSSMIIGDDYFKCSAYESCDEFAEIFNKIFNKYN
ncbi:MAG: nucleoside 2-deoxyribosyltransferase [Clostridia bacterium]